MATEKLRELLGKPALSGLLEKLRSRYSKGNYELGTLRYDVSSAAEREEIERLLGKAPSLSNTVVIRLTDLEGILKSAGLADSLYEAVVALTGSVVNRRKQNDENPFFSGLWYFQNFLNFLKTFVH